VNGLFERTVPARQVALCRIVLALAAILKAVDLGLRLSGEDVPRWPVWVGLWAAAAVALLLGVRARLAGVGLVVLFLWFISIGQYANHFAFLAVAVALLSLVDSGARWSLGAASGQATDRLPAWPVVLLQLHVCVVYLFSGVAKLNPDYATGSFLAEAWPGAMLLPDVVPPGWVFVMMGLLTVAWELTAPAGLAWRATRSWYLLFGVVAHLSMMLLLSGTWSRVLRLTIFALAAYGVYVLFLRESTVERLGSRVERWWAARGTRPDDARAVDTTAR
jgi:hypothetical protein